MLVVLIPPSAAFADEPERSSRISDVLNNQRGMGELEPINFDEMGDRFVDLGDSSFEFFQSVSLTLLVWGIGISVVILFFGILLGRAVVMAGVIGIVISILAFAMIQFMPEIVLSITNGIGSMFGQ